MKLGLTDMSGGAGALFTASGALRELEMLKQSMFEAGALKKLMSEQSGMNEPFTGALR